METLFAIAVVATYGGEITHINQVSNQNFTNLSECAEALEKAHEIINYDNMMCMTTDHLRAIQIHIENHS